MEDAASQTGRSDTVADDKYLPGRQPGPGPVPTATPSVSDRSCWAVPPAAYVPHSTQKDHLPFTGFLRDAETISRRRCFRCGRDTLLKNWQALVGYMAKSSIWWERAHEYRALAEEVPDPGRRKSYMTIFSELARVARRLEELETIVDENSAITGRGGASGRPELVSPLPAARPQASF